MNKFAILFCFFLVFNFSKSMEETELLDLMEGVIKGLFSTGGCAKVFSDNKSEFYESMKKTLEIFLKEGDLLKALSGFILNNQKIGEFLEECKPFKLLDEFKSFTTADGVTKIAENMYNNAATIYSQMNALKAAKSKVEKGEIIGKVLRMILPLSVN